MRHPVKVRFCFAMLLGAIALNMAGCLNPQTRAQSAEDAERERDLDILTIGQVTEVSEASALPVQLQGVGLVIGLDGTGGGTAPGQFRTMLERQLRLLKVENVKALLDSPNNAMVLVSALLPAGTRKGEALDVQVYLPPGSQGTSLKGGTLLLCPLRPYESSQNINPNKPNSGLPGHVLAHAKGPLLVGLGATGDEPSELGKAYIWGGGISHTDRPYALILKKDAKFAKVANKIAERINLMFFEDFKMQQAVLRNKNLIILDEVNAELNLKAEEASLSRNTAKPMNKDVVFVNIPFMYRLNAERYHRVSRWIPLQELPEQKARYRQRLRKMLRDPADTVIAAMRLEALGKESVSALQDGLKDPHPLVRFCCAESLAYLGSPSGCLELSKLARAHVELQALCLKALASQSDRNSRELLTELMNSPQPKLRGGAFRALRWCLEDPDVESRCKYDPELKRRVHGELLGGAFCLQEVAPRSTPMINFTVGQKTEVVLFGQNIHLVPPVHIRPGKEFTITAEIGDDRCTITRYLRKEGVSFRPLQCSLRLDDVLRTLAELGADYPDAVDFLRKADDHRGLSCRVVVDAQPDEYSAGFLIESVRKNPDFLRTPVDELSFLPPGPRLATRQE